MTQTYDRTERTSLMYSEPTDLILKGIMTCVFQYVLNVGGNVEPTDLILKGIMTHDCEMY